MDRMQRCDTVLARFEHVACMRSSSAIGMVTPVCALRTPAGDGSRACNDIV
jgi:hypothetical protein